MLAGRIVQLGTEQSPWVHAPLNLGPVNAVVCHCVGQKQCPRHRAALGLWEAGENRPGVSAQWEGRSASQISVPLAINSWWFLLLKAEGGVSWGILHA